MDLDYKAETGLASDANKFCEHIECVNLSVGYYKPHTSKEITNLDELEDTYNLVHTILEDPTFGDMYTRIHPRAFKELMKSTTTTYSYNKKDDKDKDDDDKKSDNKIIMSAGKYTQICPLCGSAAITKYEMADVDGTKNYIDCGDCDGAFVWDDTLGEWTDDTYGYKYGG